MNVKKVLLVLVLASLVTLCGIGITVQSVKAATIAGTVDNITSNKIIVEGLTIFTDNNTRIKGILAPGVFVKIQTTTQTNGLPVAVKIEAKDSGEYAKIEGTTANVTSTSLVVNGKNIKINGSTRVKGSLAIGATVEVKAITQSDGSLLAVKIKVDDDKEREDEDEEDEDEDEEESSD